MSKIPTIAMIPSAYKASKVYSVLPTNGDADLDFTRASTATRVNEIGLIEEVASNVPRLDYSDGGCPVQLLEPQSRNLITHSEDFNDASWNKTDCTILSNQAIAPDGTLTADLMTLTDTNGRVDQSGFASGVLRTQSVYVKSNNGQSVTVQMDFSGLDVITFETTNKWTRVSTTGTNIDFSNRIRIRIVGNVGESVLIWGAQLEEQSYATSYIPTSGATATREAETLSKTGLSNYINSSEGVLYAEISALEDDDSGQIRISEQGVLNSVFIQFRDSGTTLRTYIFDGNATNQFFSDTVVAPNTQYKIALKYKENDCALWINGVEVATDFSATMPSNLNTLSFDQGDGGNPFYGKVKDLRVYNTALTDAELQVLTS